MLGHCSWAHEAIAALAAVGVAAGCVVPYLWRSVRRFFGD